MNGPKLTLSISPKRFAVCRLSPDAEIPAWSKNTEFYSITRSRDELSVVCLSTDVPRDIQTERDWRALKIEGPLDLSLTGILVSLADPLAEARIPIFAISTYDTDYLFVQESFLSQTVALLKKEGHSIDW